MSDLSLIRTDEVVLALVDNSDTKTARKKCSKCGKRKAPSQFGKDTRKTGGLRAQCRACVQERRRELTKEKREARKAVPARNPEEEAIRLASRRAVQQLIRNHEPEFKRLIQTERALQGNLKHSWTNLTTESAFSES